MEQGFLLVKELSVSWEDVEHMPARERLWLCQRIEKWYEDQEREWKKEESKSRGKSGRIGVHNII